MSIPRLHLVELADFPWFPNAIRNLMTDYLHFMETKFRLHEPVSPILKDLVEETGITTVIDLCSGGAGPIPAIDADLRKQGVNVRFVLTDYFPNAGAFEHAIRESDGAISFEPGRVDAAKVPESLEGIRTIFNAFHHFQPEMAQTILRNAVDAQQPIAIFEFLERRVVSLLPMFLIPIIVWLVTPAIRPRTFSRFLWTYLIPVLPLVVLWDGVVSHLRCYTPAELEHLAAPFPGYTWRTGKVPIGKTGNNVTFLIGTPRLGHS